MKSRARLCARQAPKLAFYQFFEYGLSTCVVSARAPPWRAPSDTTVEGAFVFACNFGKNQSIQNVYFKTLIFSKSDQMRECNCARIVRQKS